MEALKCVGFPSPDNSLTSEGRIGPKYLTGNEVDPPYFITISTQVLERYTRFNGEELKGEFKYCKLKKNSHKNPVKGRSRKQHECADEGRVGVALGVEQYMV